jgi:nicotinate-nucleotide--dimethylbenzimidazole phosphoribosyltransferase
MNRFSDTEIEAVYRVIRERRDMRHFLPGPIEPALLERLLQAAHWAPSVGFMQPWRFIRITDPTLRLRIYEQVEAERVRTAEALGERGDEYMRLKVEGVRECGELLVATLMDKRERHVFGRRTLPEMDLASVACALQNLWLAARAEGIGMGWVSLFDPQQLRRLLNIPAGGKPVALICLGQVEVFYPRPMLEMEDWASRHPLQAMVFENGWQTDGAALQGNVQARVEASADTLGEFQVAPVSRKLSTELQHKIDYKTKPLGALGKLEQLALQIGCIQNTLTPQLNKPVIMVFAGDHGITQEGVSPYPQEVTRQMVFNFLNGGAAINVFARQHGIALRVVDAGVNHEFEPHPELINAKVAMGTRNFRHEPAMSTEQCLEAMRRGAHLVQQAAANGSNVIGFGEMGIGNTSAASMLMSQLCGIAVGDCVGRGTGLDDQGLAHKRQVLTTAAEQHGLLADPLDVLATFGGFEIAMMSGAMLQAARSGMTLLIDGFIVSSALLVAATLQPNLLDYCVFTHCSNEAGHTRLLQSLHAAPLLDVGMRLGEGTGAAVAYPLLVSAVGFLNEMASFESAGVSNKSD